MQSAVSNPAIYESLVAFLTQSCLLDEQSARAIATKNAHTSVLDDLAYGHSFLAEESDDDVPDAVEAFLQLDDLFEGEQLELIRSKLAAFFLAVRAATAAGKNNAAVTIGRRLVDEYIGNSPSRRRVLVAEVLEEPDAAALRCDENIADLDRQCKVDSADDKPASGDEASAEDESGFRTPELRGMSKRDIELINRAPFKKQRGD
jgi:hypothetical protein